MTQLDQLNAKDDEILTALAAAKKRDEDSRAALQAIIDAQKAGQDLGPAIDKAQQILDAANAIDAAPADAVKTGGDQTTATAAGATPSGAVATPGAATPAPADAGKQA